MRIWIVEVKSHEDYFIFWRKSLCFQVNFKIFIFLNLGATDDSFFERIFVHFEHNRLICKHPRQKLHFVLGHCLNTAPTVYSVKGWLRYY